MEKSSSRLKVFAILVAVMFMALSTRLWFLQVLATEQNQDAARNNSVREATTDALRGEIITADQAKKENPVPLVTNRKSLEVRVNKQALEESGRAEAVLSDLSEMLDIPVPDITAALESNRYFDYQPKPVAEFVDENVRFYIEEHQDQFPGVEVVDASVRAYPFGEMAAHIVGTLSQIDSDEVDDPAFDGYGLNDLVGRSGLEVTYEKWLRGKKGVQRYVVNADGETIRQLGEKAPTAGNDLILSLDSTVQQAAEQALDDGIAEARTMFDDTTQKNFEANAGAVVVLDAKTGGVVTMASSPTYDPRWFVRGLKPDESCYLGIPAWKCGGADSVAPLLDRAYQEVYIPGSTFKPFTALAAVKEGVADFNSFYSCPATYVHPGDTSGADFNNWSTSDLGSFQLNYLLKISCDTSFYAWGTEFYNRYTSNQFGENNEPLQKDLRQWGFQSPTGLDLPGEAEGLIPDAAWGDDPAQKAIFGEYGWPPGGDILLMIGSGYVTVTPLQLAQAYGALANDGHLCRPHLVDHIENANGRVVKKVGGQCDRTLPYTQTQLDYIMTALTQVPISGTASSAFCGFPLSEYPVAGKTGTAFRGGTFQDTSWFAGMVPANDPEYVVVAMVEQAGFGSDVAAPIVRKVIESIYDIESSFACVAESNED